jgi:hypothetical protein
LSAIEHACIANQNQGCLLAIKALSFLINYDTAAPHAYLRRVPGLTLTTDENAPRYCR